MIKIKPLYENSSIKAKLILFLGGILVSFTLFNVFTNYQSNIVLGLFDEQMDKYSYLSQLQRELNNNAIYLSRYLESGNLEELVVYNESVDAFHHILSNMKNQTSCDEEQILLRAISNTYMSFYEISNSAIIDFRGNESTYYRSLQKSKRIRQYITIYIQQLMEETLSQGRLRQDSTYDDINLTRKLIFIGNITVLAIGMTAAFYLASRLTRPLGELAKQSQKIADGQLEVEDIHIKGNYELETLANAFNLMSKNIKVLVEDLQHKSELERLLEESKFLALQSQINPHFLFNTLNTISRAVMFEKKDESILLIDALSHILRYNLKNSSHVATIKDELACIDKYIYIQRFRFGDRICYQTDIQASIELDKISIPRFTLQPLVENAIMHGLEPKEEGGILIITGEKEEQGVKLSVCDNGEGMSTSYIDQLLKGDAKRRTGHTTGIGLSNVYNRIILFNKDKDSFSISSEKGKGTKISIMLPHTHQ